MIHKRCVIVLFFALPVIAWSQGTRIDSAAAITDTIPNEKKNDLLADPNLDYDALFRDFDAFMDSILTPNSYLMTTLTLGKGYYNFEQKGSDDIRTVQKLNYLPTLAYYHRDGFGISATGYVVNDETNLNLYQVSVSPSFDYLKNRNFAAGISFSRFFTKDSLPFYTSPLENELYAYFTYRRTWLRPSIALSYGWGSRSAYEKREVFVQDLRLRRRGFIFINTTESVSDFSLIASLRHDFYWLDILTYNDHIRFTPHLSFTSGTQKFGFNQSSNTYTYNTGIGGTTNVLYNSENVYLDDQINFQPLSLSLYLRGEYSIGKFFIQPQFSMDYYFPANNNNFSTLFSLSAGLIF